MRALTVQPCVAGSADVRDVADPEPRDGELLVHGLAVGVCGTDREIVAGSYGWAPPGRDRLVLGHESLGRVLRAPPNRGFAEGDLVVGLVRRPDPLPCGACAHGEFDMCRNAGYTERGIKQLDGYGSQVWTVEPEYAVKLDPGLEPVGMLLEPTSVVAKAWEQVDRVGARSWFEPQRVLVTGAGPIGLLAALIGTQRGLDVHVLDLAAQGAKADAVSALGATYHDEPAAKVAAKLCPDVVIEATGVGAVVYDTMAGSSAYGIVCLTGISSGRRTVAADLAELNRGLVLENDVVIGTVSANRRHYDAAARALAAADPGWLAGLITRRVPLERFADALTRRPDDIKVVLTLN
jgi:threonine dehydrogenase-like Zn-dependent dehydrogenase